MSCLSCAHTTLRVFLKAFGTLPTASAIRPLTTVTTRPEPRPGEHIFEKTGHASTTVRKAVRTSDNDYVPFAYADQAEPRHFEESKQDEKTVFQTAVPDTGINNIVNRVRSTTDPLTRRWQLDKLVAAQSDHSLPLPGTKQQSAFEDNAANGDLDYSHLLRNDNQPDGGLNDQSSTVRETWDSGYEKSPNFPNTSASSTSTEASTKPYPMPRHGNEPWQIQKAALMKKFRGEKWEPRKKLSPDTLDGIRSLHAQQPQAYTTMVLAQQFQVSPEAIRRILKSKWRPSEEEEESRRERWERRGENIWSRMAEQGFKPPKKWRQKGIHRQHQRPDWTGLIQRATIGRSANKELKTSSERNNLPRVPLGERIL